MEPLVVVMEIRPDAAVEGTLNESELALTAPKLVTPPPPTLMAGSGDCSLRPAPVTVTIVPTGPKAGEKLKIVGSMRKLEVLNPGPVYGELI